MQEYIFYVLNTKTDKENVWERFYAKNKTAAIEKTKLFIDIFAFEKKLTGEYRIELLKVCFREFIDYRKRR